MPTTIPPRKSSVPGRLLACLLLGLGAAEALPALELRGRLLDGTAMMRSLNPAGANIENALADVEKVPLAGTRFRLQSLAGGARGAWEGQSDAEGRFTIDLQGLDQLPAGPSLVASAGAGTSAAKYSLHVDPKAGTGAELEFRLYQLTENQQFIHNSAMEVLYTLVDDPKSGAKLLDVRVHLIASNLSGELFVGPRLKDYADRRAVSRIPLPRGAVVLESRGRKNHNQEALPSWTATPDGWAILDSPLPPFSEAPQGVYHELRYRAPAEQEMGFAFPLDLPLTRGMLVWGIHLDMSLTSPQLTGRQTDTRPDPATPSGPELTWDVLFENRSLEAGQTIGLGMTIDSITLRQFNRGSLRVVGGMVIACLIAVMLGLILGRRGPRVEALLREAGGEEVLERIAQLDAQFARKLIAEAEYRDVRERLLAIARYEIPELEGAASAAAKAAAAPHGPPPPLPARIRELAERIAALEKQGAGDPRALQERLLLLEDLARSIRALNPEGAGEGEAGRVGERNIEERSR